MAQFVNPFNIKELDREMTLRELQRALRQSISAEEEAVHLYETYADCCENEEIKDIFQDVADEEKVHIGEFQQALEMVDDSEAEFIEEGREEIKEITSSVEAVNELNYVAQMLQPLRTRPDYAKTNPYLNTPPTKLKRMIQEEDDSSEKKLMKDALEAWRLVVPGPFWRTKSQ